MTTLTAPVSALVSAAPQSSNNPKSFDFHFQNARKVVYERHKTWVAEDATDTSRVSGMPADLVRQMYPEYGQGPFWNRKNELEWLLNKIAKAMELTEIPFDTRLNFSEEWEKFSRTIFLADVRPLNKDQLNEKSIESLIRLAPMPDETKERLEPAIKYITEFKILPHPLRTPKWRARYQVEGVRSMQFTLYLLVVDDVLGAHLFLPASIIAAQEAYANLLAAFEALEESERWKSRETRLWEPKPEKL